jgi:hypothetical protein
LTRKLRSSFHYLIAEESLPFNIDVTQWHTYTLGWYVDHLTFKADHQTFETGITPNAPLGFVLWIDNQYAAFPPTGVLSFGTLANSKAAWLEIEALALGAG